MLGVALFLHCPGSIEGPFFLSLFAHLVPNRAIMVMTLSCRPCSFPRARLFMSMGKELPSSSKLMCSPSINAHATHKRTHVRKHTHAQ